MHLQTIQRLLNASFNDLFGPPAQRVTLNTAVEPPGVHGMVEVHRIPSRSKSHVETAYGRNHTFGFTVSHPERLIPLSDDDRTAIIDHFHAMGWGVDGIVVYSSSEATLYPVHSRFSQTA